MADETPTPAEQSAAIRDVNLNVATAKGPDGATYPVLQVSLVIEAGRAGEIGAAILQGLDAADAAALAANATSGLVLPASAGKLFVPVAGNGASRSPG